MDERLMKQIIIDGLKAGKWQYLNEFVKYAISRMAIQNQDVTIAQVFDEWAENRCINPSETNFSELRLNLDYYLPKEKYKAISHLCDLLYV